MKRTTRCFFDERREELAQRAERELAHHLRIARGRLRERRRRPRRAGAPGTTCASAPTFFGSGRASPRACEVDQVAAERVDDAVDGLVGHRLARVRAAAQDEDVAAPVERVEEVMHHHRLAEAGQAADAHRDGAVFSRRLEGVLQFAKRGLAADERASPRGRR